MVESSQLSVCRHFYFSESTSAIDITFGKSFGDVLNRAYQWAPDLCVNSRSMPLYSAIEVLITAKRLLNAQPDPQMEQLCNEVQPSLLGLAQRFTTTWMTDLKLRRHLLEPSPRWFRDCHTRIFWKTFLSQKLLEGHVTRYELDALTVYLWFPNPVSFEWFEAVTQMCLYFPELKTLLGRGMEHPPGALVYQAAPFEPFNYGMATPSTRLSNPTFIASMSAKHDHFNSPEWVHYDKDPYNIYGRYEVHMKESHCFLLMRPEFQKILMCYRVVTEQDAISVSESLRRGNLGTPEHIQLLQLLQYAIRVTFESCLGIERKGEKLQPLAFFSSMTRGLKAVCAKGVNLAVVDFGCAKAGGSGKFWIACARPRQTNRKTFVFTTVADLEKQGVLLVGLP